MPYFCSSVAVPRYCEMEQANASSMFFHLWNMEQVTLFIMHTGIKYYLHNMYVRTYMLKPTCWFCLDMCILF